MVRFALRMFLLLAAFVPILLLQGQDIKSYTLQNLSAVNTINPADTNYTDLEAIGKAIGTARVVMLGEQDHGDAAAFTAKGRLIKYLHEKMGFDVLVFESDFWGLNSTWDDMQAGNFSIDSLRHNIYPIWSKCGQVQPLFTYIKEQYALGSPLIISGMDCRHALSFSQQNYMATFDSMVLQRCLLSQESKTRFRAMLHLLMAKEYRLKPKRSDRDFLFAAIDTLKQQLPYLPAFWKQELDNIKQCAANAWASHPLYTSYRDRQMASNLYWLYHEKYAGRKIIVWAHNAHTGRNFNDGKRKIYYYNETAGNEIHNLLGDTLYTIGFTSLTGTAGRLHTRPYKLAIPKGECFENWIESKKLNYAFVNFRNYTGNETFNMQGIMHWEIKANWTKIFDGEFYIRDMYPCNEVK